MTNRDRRRGPRDFNPNSTTSSIFTTRVPDPKECKRFSKMLSDPRMKNKKGTPRFIKMFRVYGIDCFDKGFELAVMAKEMFPKELSINGCPTKAAVARLKGYFHRVTKAFNGNLEIYSTKGIVDQKVQWRWHITRFRADHNKQVEEMEKISKHIAVAAKKRIANFEKRTYIERMKKVDTLDGFFDI